MNHWQVRALLVGLSIACVAPSAAAGDDDDPSCSSVTFSVFLDGSTPPAYHIVGQLCRPRHGRADAVQVLVHGASYSKIYWDFPFQPQHYSYVLRATRAGFATLAIDRLGTGESDRPPPELVSVHAAANTVHQIVGALRAGSTTDSNGHAIRFDHVVLVGHSFGSNISWTEAGIYGDVDALVLTAISHDQNPPGAPLTETDAYPANLDPKFAGLGLPDGYLTTIPGKRGELFYYLPGASPAVIAVDEQTKDTLPVGMLFDQFTTYALTQNIHVPVLNVIGDFDTLSCQNPSCTASGSVDNEASFYPADACYTQWVVPNAGHALNLHLNAPSWVERAQHWIAAALGGHGHGMHCP